MNEAIMICVLQHDVGEGLVITLEISKSYYNLSTMKMKYLLEKNNSWFCYFTLLTQQTLRREGSLWKPLSSNTSLKNWIHSLHQVLQSILVRSFEKNGTRE